MRAFAGYIGIIIIIVIGAFLGEGKPKARTDKLSGDVVFQYSNSMKLLVIFSLFIIAFILSYFAIALPIERNDIIPVVFFTAVTISLFLFETAKIFGLTYRITNEGVIRQQWSKIKFIRWEEIDKIYLRGHGSKRKFIIISPKGKLKINSDLNSLRIFAQAVKDNLPFEKWQKAEKAIDGLIGLSSISSNVGDGSEKLNY